MQGPKQQTDPSLRRSLLVLKKRVMFVETMAGMRKEAGYMEEDDICKLNEKELIDAGLIPPKIIIEVVPI